jgi:alpha-tubulin suppressor-like RCC1 family protein
MADITANTATNATFSGTVNPGGTTARAWLEWGPGNTFSQSTASTNLAAGSSPVAVNVQVAGMVPGCLYQGRLVGSNSLGVVRSRPVPFAVPVVALNGSHPLTNAQFAPFVDPGAIAGAPLIALAAGDHHALALRANGTVIGWGGNELGQTNPPASATNLVAIAAGFGHNLGLRANGSVIAWGTNEFNRTIVPATATNGVVAISAGDYHSLALKSNGTVVAWGANLDLQSDVPPAATNIVAIAAGYAFSLALRGNGTVVGWGNDDYGQVSEPMAQATNLVAISASLSHVLGLKADGTVVVWGGDPSDSLNYYGLIHDIPPGATNVVAIAAGDYHNLALKSDGTVIGWGLNDYSEITIPPEATNVIAISAGFSHSQAMRADGAIVSWGNNESGQLATPSNSVLESAFSVNVTGTVNTSVVGTYNLVYSATNVLGFAGAAARSVIVPGSPAPSITSHTRLGNGSFQLAFDYTPGTNCTVVASTNLALPLANWTVLGVASESPAGHYTFTDTAAPAHPKRFYRVRIP